MSVGSSLRLCLFTLISTAALQHGNKQINSNVQIIQYFLGIWDKKQSRYFLALSFTHGCGCVFCIILKLPHLKVGFLFCSIFCPQENTEEALLLLLISESMVSGLCFLIALPSFLAVFPEEENYTETQREREV